MLIMEQSLFYVPDSVIDAAVLLSDVSVTIYETKIPSTYPFNVLSDIEWLATARASELVPINRKIPNANAVDMPNIFNLRVFTITLVLSG